MKREFISAFRSEVWLLARHPATALMIALAAVLYVVAAATSSEVLIMVAGDDPYTLGGAIGFIGNLVDAGDVLGSVARTSFASTVVWIPVTILYAVYATSRDFESVAYAVSRSRGVSQAAIVITKLLVNCTLVGAVYLLSTTALYLTKMAQWDVGASCSGFAQFVSIALMIALLLISMYAATFALYLLTRSVVASRCNSGFDICDGVVPKYIRKRSAQLAAHALARVLPDEPVFPEYAECWCNSGFAVCGRHCACVGWSCARLAICKDGGSMNLGMSVRAELFRARRMKLAVIIALMYLGIAGIYVFAGSGAWVSAGGEGQFFGFSADPGYLFSIGVGPTGISSWLSVVSMAHTVFFPIVSVVVAGTLFGDATSVSARGVSIARGFRSWQLFAAKTLACEVYTLCPYIVFTLGVAAVFAVCSGSGLDSLTVGNVTSALLSNIVIDAAYTLMVAVAYEVFRIRSLVSGALLVATFAGLVIAMSFPTVLPPVHMAYWMRACGAAGGTVLMAACGHAVIVSLACLLLLSCSFYRRR